MSNFQDFSVSTKKVDNESLRINTRTGCVNGVLTIFKYRDKDTRQIVMYCPSLEITSYGATEEKATEMMKFSIEDYFSFIIELSAKKLDIELNKLGWKHNKLRKKEFSKAFVDNSGQLKNFNAVANKVERITLEA